MPSSPASRTTRWVSSASVRHSSSRPATFAECRRRPAGARAGTAADDAMPPAAAPAVAGRPRMRAASCCSSSPGVSPYSRSNCSVYLSKHATASARWSVATSALNSARSTVFVDRIDFAIATREFRHPYRRQRRGGAQQRLAPELQQVLPLGACPLAEHRKRAEAQAVEEAAARNGGRRRPVAGGVRGAHRGHIVRQGDAQAALLRHERVVDAPLAEQRAQPIEIDPEIVLRRLLAGVGPHQRGDLLAPHPVRARGEVGEEVARRTVRDVEVRVADLDARRGEQPEHRLVCTHRARCPRTRRASAIDGLPDRSEPCVRAARMHSRRRRADFAARVADPAAS